MTTMAPPRKASKKTPRKASKKVAETPPPAAAPPEPEPASEEEIVPGAVDVDLLEDLLIDTDTLMLEGVDTSSGPLFGVSEMAQFFFARSSHWVRWLETEGRMVLDGKPIVSIRTASNARKYDLTLVERIAHGLASNNTIDGQQLRKALLLVKIEAVMHGHLSKRSEEEAEEE